MGVFKVLGVDAASALGGFLGREIFYRTGMSARARANLVAAYPGKKSAEIEIVLREMWDNLGRTVAEYPHLAEISRQGPNARTEMVGAPHADAAIAMGKGVLFFSAHFSNWEVMPLIAIQRGYQGGEVYRPPNNPYVSRWIVAQRLKCGPLLQIQKGAQGTRQIFTQLRRGQSIFLLADQKTNEGISVPFFGREAMTTPAPASLALKLDAPLVPVYSERLRGARFRLTVLPPLVFERSGEQQRDVHMLTAMINEILEKIVRERPSQWLWLHRRWPRSDDKPTGRRSVSGSMP